MSDPSPESPSAKKRPLLSILIIIAILGALGYWGYTHYAAKDTKDTASTSQSADQGGNQGSGGRHGHHQSGGKGDGATPVTVATAQKANIDITQQGLGTVTPLANITVKTQISGLMTEVGFQEGQIVQKGDFLAQIDARPYQNALEQAQGTLVRDQALLKDAELNLERYRKLVSQDSIAKQQLTSQESLVLQYQGNIQTDQGQIDTANLNLAYCHIVSPVTGRVGIRQVDAGNYVQVNDPLVTVTQLQPISVLFNLPEDDVPPIMKRLADHAELKTTAFDRAQTTKLADGKLASTDNQINTSTGTLKFRANFDNQDNALFPNQFVNITLLVDTLRDAITIPSAAILHGTPGSYVYLVKDDKTVTVRPIKTGPVQDDKTAVLDGLAVGDTVVMNGIDNLRDGAHVTIP